MTTPQEPSIYSPGPYDQPPTRPLPAPPPSGPGGSVNWVVVSVAAAAAAVVLLVAGGGAVWFLARPSGNSPTAVAAATPTRPDRGGATSPPKSFEDADELVQWLTAFGLDCGEIDHVDGPLYAISMIDCGRTVVAAVYEDHPHAVRAVAALEALNKQAGNPTYVAIGSNWTVSSSDSWYAKNAAKRLGGTYQAA